MLLKGWSTAYVKAHTLACENLKRSGERAQKYYDFGVKPKKYKVAEKVWVLNARRFKKAPSLL